MKHNDAPRAATPVAHTIPEAARIAGVSTRKIRYAIARGDPTVRYPTHRPVVLHDELVAWVATAPTAGTAATGSTHAVGVVA
jgi:hypothetical protein